MCFLPGFGGSTQTCFFIAEQESQLFKLAKGEKEDDEVGSTLSCSNAGFAFNGASLNTVYKPAVNILTKYKRSEGGLVGVVCTSSWFNA